MNLSNGTTTKVNLQDLKTMGYAEWRYIMILLKNKPRSAARDEVKNCLRVLLSQADLFKELPEGVLKLLNVGLLKQSKKGINKFIWER